ncbi:MAG TPA: GDSL-type esterase/lipase family protein [Pirellulales bacterium]|nr:GDSL-type esterase/lipase family protein [Pirellulales bacterium]
MTDQGRSVLTSARRIGRTVALVVPLAASLLAFPSGMVPMTACWLIAYTAAAVRRQRAIMLLIAPVLVVLVKRVDWPLGLWAFMAAVLAAIAVSAVSRSTHKDRRYLISVLVWVTWLGFAIDSRRAVRVNHAARALDGRPIVCIGDSLTSYTKNGGYPEVLAEMVAVPVVNLGQPGVTSAEALRKLPDLVAAKPQIVVIELGGHDFLKDSSLFKSASRALTKANIEALVEAARQSNAEVVLIEVPRGFVVDPYAGLERQIAREQGVALISDAVIRQFVLSSPVAPPGMWLGGPYLSDDGLHPNRRGNLLLARAVLEALERVYGPVVRRVETEVDKTR